METRNKYKNLENMFQSLIIEGRNTYIEFERNEDSWIGDDNAKTDFDFSSAFYTSLGLKITFYSEFEDESDIAIRLYQNSNHSIIK